MRRSPRRKSTYLSPRGAVAYRAGRYQMQASAYYANRTPTLNELHRRFAVGNQITNANPLLDPETLTGVEGGVLAQFARASVRATAFFNNLDGAIANVTLSQTPTADRPAAPELRHDSRDRRRNRSRHALLEHPERERPDCVHVEPFPRLGGDAGDRGQLRAAGAESAGRRGADVGRSALVHRRNAGALQRRTVRRRPQYAGVRARRYGCGMRRSAARWFAASMRSWRSRTSSTPNTTPRARRCARSAGRAPFASAPGLPGSRAGLGQLRSVLMRRRCGRNHPLRRDVRVLRSVRSASSPRATTAISGSAPRRTRRPRRCSSSTARPRGRAQHHPDRRRPGLLAFDGGAADLRAACARRGVGAACSCGCRGRFATRSIASSRRCGIASPANRTPARSRRRKSARA